MMDNVDKAIILAGGMGTRIREAAPNLPKSLIEVTDKPILYYIIKKLHSSGINEFTFSIGYKHEKIVKYIDEAFPKLNVQFVIEDYPLGTGGAVHNALLQKSDHNYLIVNGDTFTNYDLLSFVNFHLKSNYNFSIVSVEVQNASRYGSVTFQEDRISHFNEKSETNRGWINAGHYLINSSFFRQLVSNIGLKTGQKFSLEDLMGYVVDLRQLTGFKSDGNFIDIGIPTDLQYAREAFKWPDY